MSKETSTLIRLINPERPSDGRYNTQCNSPPVPDDAFNAPISIHHPHQQKSTKPSYSNNLLASCLNSLFMAIAISLFFLLVSILTIIIHILVYCLVLHRRRSRHSRATTTRPLPNSLELEEDYNLDHFCGVGFGLFPSDLRNFPSFNYYKQASVEPALSTQDCIVCLENFREGELCRILPKWESSKDAGFESTLLINQQIFLVSKPNLVVPGSNSFKAVNVFKWCLGPFGIMKLLVVLG
ncbi:hypothetical protein BVC80_8923g7 [Macleaya cordata]|uniref:Zinc finger protein n=1 Tax=Macleaya cordata TaxID=56857 RepID=A0A200PVH8_MACCD|nr:hypothetical protein BVC80_8923g7 [Macleaya cordata]